MNLRIQELENKINLLLEENINLKVQIAEYALDYLSVIIDNPVVAIQLSKEFQFLEKKFKSLGLLE